MTWSQELKHNVTDIARLQKQLGLSDSETKQLQELCTHFPMSVTRYYLKLIDWSDPCDPIRRMCIPTFFETDQSGAFDTSGEASNTVCEGVQHKYRESTLILTTNRCAMYCRHCFRKRLVGSSDEEIASSFHKVIDYIHDHKEISNVILSGGDALMLPTEMLSRYLSAFAEMEHLDSRGSPHENYRRYRASGCAAILWQKKTDLCGHTVQSPQRADGGIGGRIENTA